MRFLKKFKKNALRTSAFSYGVGRAPLFYPQKEMLSSFSAAFFSM